MRDLRHFLSIMDESNLNEKQPLLTKDSEYSGTAANENYEGACQCQTPCQTQTESPNQAGPLFNRHKVKSSCVSTLKKELQLKNLRFTHDTPQVFFSSQWHIPAWIFLLYRTIIAVYIDLWLFLSILYSGSNKFPWEAWLTNWSYFMLSAHVTLSLIISILHNIGRICSCQPVIPLHTPGHRYNTRCTYGSDGTSVSAENGDSAHGNSDCYSSDAKTGNPCRNSDQHNSSQNSTQNGETGIDCSTSQNNTMNDHGIETADNTTIDEEVGRGSDTSLVENGRLNKMCDPNTSGSAIQFPASAIIPWYIKLNWFVYSIIFNMAFVVTIVYFSAIYPQKHREGQLPSLEDFHMHMLNSVVVLFELAFSALPVRIIHVVYPFLYGLIYIIFSCVYWATDHSNVLYPHVLDWNHPGQSAAIVLSLGIVGIPLLQVIVFSLYRLRLYFYSKLYSIVDIN